MLRSGVSRVSKHADTSFETAPHPEPRASPSRQPSGLPQDEARETKDGFLRMRRWMGGLPEATA